MRRADRLFQIVQLLRRDHITTAARLAVELEISERTLYRDVADLMASGVPIESEAGVGYRLPRHFDLPPMMFTLEEAEALQLGLRIAGAWTDSDLKAGAESALRKLKAVLPEKLKAALADSEMHSPDFHVSQAMKAPMSDLRRAVRLHLRVHMDYQDGAGNPSSREVRPLGLFFWGGTWTLAAWCERREDFRTFRLDRLQAWKVLDPFPVEQGQELADYLRCMGGS